MKLIAIGSEKFTKVDDSDYILLSTLHWHILSSKKKDYFYAKTSRYNNNSLMHRIILNVTDSKLKIDHIDGDGLNNQRYNLRICSQTQNTHNRRKPIGKHTSIYKGVYFDKSRKSKPWRTNIVSHGKDEPALGFATEKEAAISWNISALKVHGEFARLNIIL